MTGNKESGRKYTIEVDEATLTEFERWKNEQSDIVYDDMYADAKAQAVTHAMEHPIDESMGNDLIRAFALVRYLRKHDPKCVGLSYREICRGEVMNCSPKVAYCTLKNLINLGLVYDRTPVRRRAGGNASLLALTRCGEMFADMVARVDTGWDRLAAELERCLELRDKTALRVHADTGKIA